MTAIARAVPTWYNQSVASTHGRQERRDGDGV